jgi:hypothetical protein
VGKYSLDLNTVAAANAAAYCSFHTSASIPCRLTYIMVTLNASTASAVRLGIPANTPVATTSANGEKTDRNIAASGSTVDTAWSTAPTAPTQFIEGGSFPASAGSGVIWQWDEASGLYLAPSQWLCLWNNGGSTASILSATFRWIE